MEPSSRNEEKIELFERVHEFGDTNDGKIGFVCSVVVFGDNHNTFVARIAKCIPLEGPINLGQLEGVRVIPEKTFPKFDPCLSALAPDSLPLNCYRKRPSLVDYNEDGDNRCVGKLLLHEARVCEVLKNSPHANVCKYYGCIVQEGRIVGLCFEKLDETLYEKLRRKNQNLNVAQCLEGIQKGLEHIHSLGFCHNDVNPANIMFRRDGSPVITDFDSCEPIGAKLSLNSGTPDWCHERREISEERNDFYGLELIQKYIKQEAEDS